MNEIWKPISGFEGFYEVSNFGKVRSIDRVVSFKGRWGETKTRMPSRLLKLNYLKAGYVDVQLAKEGNHFHRLVHRLVAEAFIGASDLQVNHKDGNKDNNHVENLEWCSHSENQIHCTTVLKKRIGEKNKSSKLKEADVLAIRNDARLLREIAKDYEVTLQAVHLIKSGKNWAHLSQKENA